MTNKTCVTLAIILYLSVSMTCALAQDKPLTLKVITTGEPGLHTNFTLVMGETDAVLIDAPFMRSDAFRLVAEILDSGKILKYVYITHDHPDHFFNVEVIAENFPEAEIIAAPVVVEEVYATVAALRGTTAILLVEHNLDLALALADRVYVLDRGAVTHTGPARVLLEDLDLRARVLWF